FQKVASVLTEAHIDVPTRVAWIFGRRESNRKRPDRADLLPSAFADERIECGVKASRIRGREERRIEIVPKPNHRPRPRRGIVGIATGIAPENRARFFG